mmetsp:Transcript_28228/g.49333  ORF Transcript_28228/g.49333 Transcript_28228/m.49333 type:complete len:155 (-) Transcript_28228:323-787(-)
MPRATDQALTLQEASQLVSPCFQKKWVALAAAPLPVVGRLHSMWVWPASAWSHSSTQMMLSRQVKAAAEPSPAGPSALAPPAVPAQRAALAELVAEAVLRQRRKQMQLHSGLQEAEVQPETAAMLSAPLAGRLEEANPEAASMKAGLGLAATAY